MSIKVSEITLREAIEKVNGFAPVKIIFNGVILYNDYDSEVVVEVLEDGEKVYGEVLPPLGVIPNRLWQFDKYVVTSIKIDIVEFHHSIVTMNGEYCNIEN